MKKSIILAAIGGFLMSQPATAQEWSKEQAEVWNYVVWSWDKHVNTGTWAEVLDPNGYGWNSAYPVPVSRSQMTARNDVFGKEGKILYYQVDPIKIAVNGNTAIAYYYANIVETDHAEKRQNNIERCADTLIKRNDKWHFLGWFCETKSADDKD